MADERLNSHRHAASRGGAGATRYRLPALRPLGAPPYLDGHAVSIPILDHAVVVFRVSAVVRRRGLYVQVVGVRYTRVSRSGRGAPALIGLAQTPCARNVTRPWDADRCKRPRGVARGKGGGGGGYRSRRI